MGLLTDLLLVVLAVGAFTWLIAKEACRASKRGALPDVPYRPFLPPQ